MEMIDLKTANGWKEKEKQQRSALAKRWKEEKDKGLAVKHEELKLGNCWYRYFYYFADGSGFMYDVMSD